MADVFYLLLCFILVVITGYTVYRLVCVIREARHMHRAVRRREQRLRQNLAKADAYVHEVNQATSDKELDRLENERNREKWDGSS
jgi:predicted Holliday junction resolvase-like endonuclease